MVILVLSNLGNTIAEFAGIAAGMEFSVYRNFISVPIAAFVVWLAVIIGSNKHVEKVLLFFCVVYVSYIISGLMIPQSWGEIVKSTITPIVLNLIKNF
jgi:Mn2+/Fe2+ NRAMP family transporter